MIEDAQIREAAKRYADFPEEVEPLIESVRQRLAWRLRHGFKICSSCREEKPVTAFGSDASRRDGLAVYCRACRAG